MYRQEADAVQNATASIGITAIATGSGNFLSLNGTGTAPTASSTSETTDLSVKPASGQTYTFTPPVPIAPTSLSFSSISGGSMTLNWTDNSSNENGFVIYCSTDGVTYSYVSQTAAGATSSVQSGLTPTTTYYWKVYAVSEGAFSTALSGNQATITPPPANITGTVFEDKNYGGGAGRTLAASSGVVLSGITIELYNSAGTYISNTTTNVSGVYTFSSLAGGNYIVRAINPVTSSRGAGALKSVQTYRTDATSGTAVAVTDRVGGQTPGLADAGPRVTTLAALTTATLTPQSITSATLSGINITGVDFGYSFNVIVNKNNADQGSLRQFILNANALPNTGLAQSGLTAGIDNAVFMLADGTARPGLTASYATMFASGIASIAPTTTFATISDPVILDASLQPGYVSTPMIELNGAGAGASTVGLTISAGSSTVRGFIINRYLGYYGIDLITNGSNTITGNYIGTNAAGTAASANGFAGIDVASTGNTIGGTTTAARNILSGNPQYGIYITGNNNTVQGNYIGTNAAGTAAIGVSTVGVGIFSVTGNTIGGTAAGAGNVISGNLGSGIYINGGGSNIVQGNYIGTNPAGTATIANLDNGVVLTGSTTSNTIGGTTAGAGNVISGNGNLTSEAGIAIISTSNNNIVQGNYIGTNAAGTAALGNTGRGISIETGASSNTIGGTTAGAGNTISGNTQYGVYISNATTTGNIVQGNYIGRNAANTAAIAGHSIAAVSIAVSSDNNAVGGTAAGAGNVISGNSAIGITIAANSTGNSILSNSIYANTGIGIDLASVAAANDGTKTSTLANYGMDEPVFTTASLIGTTLTLAGYVGSAAGQSTFAAATVQIFKSDNDASGYGEGQTFLGTLTADASGNFSGSFIASGVVVGDNITGTATDATNNTSEFGPNAILITPIVLPVSFTSIKAAARNKIIQVDWDVAEESGIQVYQIEKATDGIHFSKAGEQAAKGNSTGASYQWLDMSPVQGNNYYRVRAVQADGNSFLTKIVTVKINETNPVIRIFPNPVINRQIKISSDELAKAEYSMQLLNPQGQQVFNKKMDHPGGAFNQVIYLPETLS
ncbi:MAG: SdrD B-like domain-containing protein, partial [Ferruginibacter sp.]